MSPGIATLATAKGEGEEAAASGAELSMADRVRLLPQASKSDPVVYWEYQGRDRLCGLHCLNSCLQGPIFTEVDLSTVGLQLDEEERKLIFATSEGNTELSELLAGGSANVADDGFFSITVLEECLKQHCISITPSGALPHVVLKPTDADAFVCHHHDHWFTIRKLHGNWYNLDSLRPAPSRIGEFYLGAFLHHLIEQGYSVFVVASVLPDQHLPMPCDSDRLLNSNQFYLTDKQIDALIQLDRQTHQKSLEAETLKYGGASSSAASVPSTSSHSWPAEGGRRINDAASTSDSSVPTDVDDPSLAEAIKLSLAEFASTLPRPPEEPNLDAPNVVTIQVRLPNQEKLVRRFKDTEPIKSIFHWLEIAAQKVIAANTSYELVASFPRRILRRMGREMIEYQSADALINTNCGDQSLNDVVKSTQDVFMLQVI